MPIIATPVAAESARCCEVAVCGEHRQFAAQAKLRQQCVYRADLDLAAAAGVAQCSGLDMVVPVGNKDRQRGKPVNDLRAGAGA